MVGTLDAGEFRGRIRDVLCGKSVWLAELGSIGFEGELEDGLRRRKYSTYMMQCRSSRPHQHWGCSATVWGRSYSTERRVPECMLASWILVGV